MNADVKKNKLSVFQKLGYGLGDMGSNCFYALVTTFLLAYLTDTAGLNAGIVGTLILISKFLDGISDLFFGRLLDNTHSKMGKARPWVLWSSIPLAVCLFMLFSVPSAISGTAQYIYVFIVYTAANAVCYTANNIAYNTLTALVTKDQTERVSMGAFRYPFSVLTNILIAMLTVPMVSAFGGGASGWRMTALTLAVLEIIGNVIAVFSVKELPEEELAGSKEMKEEKAEKKLTFVELFKIIIHNDYYLLMLAVQFLIVGLTAFNSAGLWYFCNWQMGNAGLIGTFSMVSLTMILGIAVSPVLVRKFGMYRVNLVSFGMAAVFSVLLAIAGFMKSLPLIMIMMLLRSIAMGPLTGSINALVAEVAMFTKHTEGLSIEGSIYSCISVGQKVGGGFGTAISGWLLAFGGYNGLAEVQTSLALQMINVSYLVLPAVCAIVLTACLWKLDVEKKNKEWEQEHSTNK